MFSFILAQSDSFSKIRDEVMQSCCSQSVQGIPNWLAIVGLAAILICTHFFINTPLCKKLQSYAKFDLFSKFPFIHKLIKKPFFPLLIQSVSMLTFIFIIYAGFFGSQRVNIAPILVWTIWWILLIFLCTFLATGFCSICPWEGFSSLATSLSLKSRKKKIGFNFKWPKKLRNVYPALLMFLLLTWIELGVDITKSPKYSAIMALGFVFLAVFSALIFEKRAFCTYACLVGRISGLYALFSPIELRPDSREVCRSCTTKDCYKGNETAVGCPTGLFPGGLTENNGCTLCTECIRACPHDNLRLNVRSVASDLMTKSRFKFDEAIFCIVLLALTAFHGLTMTPAWIRLVDMLRAETGMGKISVFTVLMTVMILLPLVIFYSSAVGIKQFTKNTTLSTKDIFKAFAYPLIPVALFYHLAHNGMHFFMEAQNLIPLISDPLGRGWDLFGTAGNVYEPLMSLGGIWGLQVFLIIMGHVYGIIVADRVGKLIFKDKKDFVVSMFFQILVMILFSSFSVWLIAQPMDMRSAM